MKEGIQKSDVYRQLIMILKGGLGEQLFQYAMGLRISQATGRELKFCWQSEGEWINRQRLSKILDISIEKTTPPQKNSLGVEYFIYDGDYKDGITQDIINKASAQIDTFVLEGYYQNEKYWITDKPDEIRLQILNHMKDDPTDQENTETIGVIIQRNKWHNEINDQETLVCQSRYFNAIIQGAHKQNPNLKYRVFCDDPFWLVENVKLPEDKTWEGNYVRGVSIELLDIYEMMNCERFILGNSLIGWWIAYLSGSEKVVCPAKFYKTRQWDIFPDKWMRITKNLQ